VSIGKLIKSNSHTDYICQICGPGEVKTPPAPANYAFGTFVRAARGVPSLAAQIDALVELHSNQENAP
jgi:hypothetical protein